LLEKIEEFDIIKTLKGVASGISVTRSSIRKKFPALYEIARLVNKQVSFLFLTIGRVPIILSDYMRWIE